MFVKRSTHDAVVRERDAARAAAQQHARLVGRLRGEIARLEAEVARTSIRGHGGKFTKRATS